MFPLSTVLFPHSELPLHVFEPRFRDLTADCLADDGEFGIVLIERGPEIGGGDSRASVGTLARIDSATPLADGRWSLVTEATRRFRIRRWVGEQPYPLALIEELPEEQLVGCDDLLERTFKAVRQARALLSELGEAAALPSEVELGSTADETAWKLCALAPLTPFDAQRLLELEDSVERLRALEALCEAFAADLHRLLAGG
jgi:Lon protease-like protein